MTIEAKTGYNTYNIVFSFTSRVGAKAITMDPKSIVQNLDCCLLEAAGGWYTNQLNDTARSGLHDDNRSLELWCINLEARFRDSPKNSLSTPESLGYIICDATKRRDFADFVTSIVLNIDNAEVAST